MLHAFYGTGSTFQNINFCILAVVCFAERPKCYTLCLRIAIKAVKSPSTGIHYVFLQAWTTMQSSMGDH